MSVSVGVGELLPGVSVGVGEPLPGVSVGVGEPLPGVNVYVFRGVGEGVGGLCSLPCTANLPTTYRTKSAMESITTFMTNTVVTVTGCFISVKTRKKA